MMSFIRFEKTHETWDFEISIRDAAMIAIMDDEILDPNTYACYGFPVDVTQEPESYMGIYNLFVMQIDVVAFHDEYYHLGYTLADLRDAILIWIGQFIDRAYKFNPLDDRPDRNDDNYCRQRKVALTLDPTL